jgi:quercetin dioxygenase-like cupin family protein
MAAIIRMNERDIPWSDYAEIAEGQTPGQVRYKALSRRGSGAPSMTYVEYAPGHADSDHSHDTGEVFIVTAGEFRLDDLVCGPGSAVYVPAHTDYAMVSGDEGVQFYRIVVP